MDYMISITESQSFKVSWIHHCDGQLEKAQIHKWHISWHAISSWILPQRGFIPDMVQRGIKRWKFRTAHCLSEALKVSWHDLCRVLTARYVGVMQLGCPALLKQCTSWGAGRTWAAAALPARWRWCPRPRYHTAGCNRHSSPLQPPQEPSFGKQNIQYIINQSRRHKKMLQRVRQSL